MADEEATETEEQSEKKGGKKKIIIIAIVVLLLGLGAGGGVAYFLFAGDEPVDGEAAEEVEEEEEPEEEIVEEVAIPAQYLALEPEFVISYQVGTRQRFLQVSIELMTRSQTVLDAATKHSPMIRNEFIRVISQQDFDNLRTAEGRATLQRVLLEAAKSLMAREVNNDGVEAVLFTNYVMQ